MRESPELLVLVRFTVDTGKWRYLVICSWRESHATTTTLHLGVMKYLLIVSSWKGWMKKSRKKCIINLHCPNDQPEKKPEKKT